jgi:hypothetical protein
MIPELTPEQKLTIREIQVQIYDHEEQARNGKQMLIAVVNKMAQELGADINLLGFDIKKLTFYMKE